MRCGRRPSACDLFFCPSHSSRRFPGDPSARHRFVALEQLEGPDAELVNRLNTAYRKVLSIGPNVFVPPIFSAHRRPYVFHVSQLRLLNELTQTTDLVEACKKAGIGLARAKRFLKSPDYLEFAAEAVMDQAVHDGWTARRIVIELDRIYRGEHRVADTQMDALKMLREIVAPRKHDGSVTGGLTVNLNFPVLPEDVQSRLKALADEAAVIDVQAA